MTFASTHRDWLERPEQSWAGATAEIGWTKPRDQVLDREARPAARWFVGGELVEAPQLVVYCNLGWRSALAAKALQEMGLGNVAYLGGGFDAWKDEGGPVAELPSRRGK